MSLVSTDELVQNLNKVVGTGEARLGQLAIELGIDATASTPLYLQVRNGLTRLIKKQHFGADVALPSERSLASLLGISRVTARKAIDALASDGLIIRRHGSGNYIAPQVEPVRSRLSSFGDELKSRGHLPESRWTRRVVDTVLPEEMVALRQSPGARVARLECVWSTHGRPLALESSTLPIAMVPEPQAVEESLYSFLAARQLMPVRALQHIRAANATAQQAAVLGVAPGHALLAIARIGYLADDHAIELTNIWCRSDVFPVVADLRR